MSSQTGAAILRLSNGREHRGRLIGASSYRSGEMVFSTGMVGYSEAITDPSYFGQILVFSYPLIGNYGIPNWGSRGIEGMEPGQQPDLPRGFESGIAHAAGVILTTDSDEVFHWNSYQNLDRWLFDQGVPGIIGVDTRDLIHSIRSTPQLLGKIIPDEDAQLREKADKGAYFDPGHNEIVSRVSVDGLRRFGSGKKRIAVVDCGVKWNILRQLLDADMEIELVPFDYDLSSVDCDGWLFSNGPGNPENTSGLISRVEGLLRQDRPILGICLGHQILALAAGAKVRRMTYGHRGHNQPVYQVGTKRGYITSQNHGYVVEEDSLPNGWEPWFRNANDETNEGIRHVSKPFRSVQFHPEAAGGPRDTNWVMHEFVKEVTGNA